MKLHYIILILSFVIIGCGSTHNVRAVIVPRNPLTQPIQLTQLEQLRKDVNSILADSLFVPANASIKVVSLEKGDILFEHDSKALMNPGSNMKMLTSAAALSVLDVNYQFKTAVFMDAAFIGGVLDGNIYLKGYGDPDLKTSDLDSLAKAIHQIGIMEIKGDIIVDDSFFDDNYWGAGWAWDDESDSDAPYINALSVNKNCIRISLLADLNSIYPYLEPRTEFVTIINRAKIAADSIRNPLKIKRSYLNNLNTFVIEGDLLKSSRLTMKLPICRPQYYTGTLFKESLNHTGILVRGNIVNGTTPFGIREIAQHYQPIEKMITYMNKVSDNLSAENTLKVLGAAMYSAPGCAENGIFVINRFLSDLGIDTSKLSIVDGSGVSRYNLLSADQLVQFLTAMYKQPRIFPIFYNSLPIAGVDGTLSKRMTTYPAAGNLHAKTGNLNGVSCLSGYVLTRDGEMLVFSIMIQNFIGPEDNYLQVQDRIANLLAGFSRMKTFQQSTIK
jgi:D-alanyl-D-alanine carboxypeptidase/D-alanyl-D-alanine-endopeptidase (penicillin-binding protein 4)